MTDISVPSWDLFLARYDRALGDIITERVAQKEATDAARRASRGKRTMYEMEEKGESVGRSSKRSRN
ncbi:hypothetical protein BWQ96_00927 [Gracilariopsis chorda]|uniref:Uncharacterized protein n=1 Tax=Gracilariopsis chorda TaxID=448386 RepID=A0A2V3J4W0_9FLOR|nr:hypothetical protein BWQ96_00913 [Gracilariopsis chorda]PXF49353.1 hypothetical protein BWQ96_00927 [Gracilariopsis chorda]|eukprot:PXF49339.1 hypothetical protein BWQ96_00913 [Gracilariopsis chorda]